MITEISELIGLEIYTENAVFLGTVDNIVLDLEKSKLYGLFVRRTNPTLVEDSNSILIPFRWVRDIADIVLLNYFPELVRLDDVKDKMRKVRRVRQPKHHVIPEGVPEALGKAEKALEHGIEHGIEVIKSKVPHSLPHFSQHKKKTF